MNLLRNVLKTLAFVVLMAAAFDLTLRQLLGWPSWTGYVAGGIAGFLSGRRWPIFKVSAAQTPDTARLGGSGVQPVLSPSDAVAPVCCYCKKPDPAWSAAELQRGRRDIFGGIEYHCYEGYCLD